LCVGEPNHSKLGRNQRCGRAAKEPAAMMIDLVRDLDIVQGQSPFSVYSPGSALCQMAEPGSQRIEWLRSWLPH
jgi:hypothetical protein